MINIILIIVLHKSKCVLSLNGRLRQTGLQPTLQTKQPGSHRKQRADKMKTQISTLINGSQFEAGTNHEERSAISNQVITENQEVLTIKFQGHIMVLTANWSTSRNSVSYLGSFLLIYIDLYGEITVSLKKMPNVIYSYSETCLSE